MNNQYDIAPEKLQRRQLTARNLEDFRLCPHKYLLSLLLTPADSRKFLGGPAALQRATRAALVECYRDGGPQQVPLDSLLELFEQDWEGRLCSDSLEEAQLHARGVDVLTAYHHAHHDQPNQTIAVALRLAGEIEGFSFVAVADRVDRDESGLITLLRYRSASKTPGPGALGKDISAGLLLLLGTMHYAPQPCQSAIYALRRGRLTVAEIDEAQLARVREQIIETATELKSAQDFPAHKGQHCRWCRSRANCPAWASAHYRRGGSQ